MLLETIRALNNAGRIALQNVCGLDVTAESVSLLGQGSLSFPALGDLIVTGGGVGRVHLGCDALLCRRLGELDRPDRGGTGMELLAQAVLETVLEEVPGWRPRGRVGGICIEPLSIRTRGIRTFGFRFVTAAGQFFMMAEVPSRAEWEHGRGSDFLATMAETYLPAGWATRNALAGQAGVENFLVFLRKVEADVYVKVPGVGDEVRVVPAIFIGNEMHEGQRTLKLALKLPENAAELPFPGAIMDAHVGVGERSVDFQVRYIGRGDHQVGQGAVLKCAHFSVPDKLAVVQHRGNFRIPIEDPIPVDLVAAAAGGPVSWRRQRAERLVVGTLADLSFSGARVTLDRNEPAGAVCLSQRVVCRLHLPGLPARLELDGVVRRVSTIRAESDEACEEVGIEFLPAERQPPGALQRVRDFVLSEQRAWLARRIQVAGVGEW